MHCQKTKTKRDMKRTLFLMLCAAAPAVFHAQTTPERIQSPIICEKDSAYYSRQTEAWKAAVSARPTDEEAWRNYYRAAWYKRWYDERDTTSAIVFREMQRAVPDSYIYYYAGYREQQGNEASHRFAEEAIKRLPTNKSFEEYDIWTGYLAMRGDEKRLAELCKQYYESGNYPSDILQYNYNELQGMDNGGIYIGNGDAILIPKWLLQHGKGVHQDKIIVAFSFLAIPEYCEKLFQKLDIGDVPPSPQQFNTMQEYDNYLNSVVDTIIRRSGRSVYFSPLNTEDAFKPWAERLYNEGLLLKYSSTKYDNMSVKRRNVEQRYLMEYLIESFSPTNWSSANNLSANYAVMLADLLAYYKRNDTQRYKWLMRTLICAVNRTDFSQEKKNQYLNLLQ